MRTIIATMTGLVILTMVSASGAQMGPMPPPQSSQSQSPAPQSQAPMTGSGMMGGMMCPMMGQPMMGMGMAPGMMGGKMGTSDPKAAARMLKLHVDMMKAMGEVMVKHGQAMEQEK